MTKISQYMTSVSENPQRRALADRKQALTRETILAAAAQAIAEVGLDFSVQDAAKRAGVTHRTIYRYFENRDTLLDAVCQWQNARLQAAGTISVESLDQLPEGIERLFRAFDQSPELTRVAVLTTLTRGEDLSDRRGRSQHYLQIFAQAFPHLPPDEIATSFAVIRALAGSIGWYVLSREFGLSGDESGPAVRRALEVLIADLHQRDTTAAASAPRVHPEAKPAC